VATSAPQEPRNASQFSQPQSPEAAFEPPPAGPMNLVYAHAMFGGVLGILFAIAITAPMKPKSDVAVEQHPAVQQAAVAHPAPPAPVVRDLGAFSTGPGGLKGHLITTWLDKLSYQFEMGPDDPTESDAFAYTVTNPQRPLSVDVQLKSAAGQPLCNQDVVVKYDPLKAVKRDADLDKLEAQEQEREHTGDVFRDNLSEDGKIESISSQGTMPCTKQQFDSVAAWSFAAQFPDLREEEALLKSHIAAQTVARASAPRARSAVRTPVSHPLVAALKTPVLPAKAPEKAPAIAEAPVLAATPDQSTLARATVAHAPAAFTYAIEGDDEIVDVDAAQKSIQTTAGKTFVVEETLAANNGDGVLDELANIHYRCNQNASCTLSLADATVLHATLRTHRASPATTELSMSDSEGSLLDVGAVVGMGR
jgi:hypothetical protein